MQQGCTTAGIGCIECKEPVIDEDLAPRPPRMRERARPYIANPGRVREILASGRRACQ